jgi:hypothetical protein
LLNLVSAQRREIQTSSFGNMLIAVGVCMVFGGGPDIEDWASQ